MIDTGSEARPVQVIDCIDGKIKWRERIDNENYAASSKGKIVGGPKRPSFGLAEIAAPSIGHPKDCPDSIQEARPSAELCDALMECHRESTTQLLVRGWKEKVSSFAPPYKLYIEMLVGGLTAVDHVLSDDFFRQHRERAPSPEKVALIAMTVFVKPEKEDQSACSDYACVLEHAHDMNVAPSDLAEWLLATTLSNCKRKIRAKRKAEKIGMAGRSETVAASQVTADLPPDSSDLDVSTQETEHGTDRLVKFKCPLGRVELIAPADNVGPLPELLRQLADHLEKTASQKEANDA